jgi:hypothetical protein
MAWVRIYCRVSHGDTPYGDFGEAAISDVRNFARLHTYLMITTLASLLVFDAEQRLRPALSRAFCAETRATGLCQSHEKNRAGGGGAAAPPPPSSPCASSTSHSSALKFQLSPTFTRLAAGSPTSAESSAGTLLPPLRLRFVGCVGCVSCVGCVGCVGCAPPPLWSGRGLWPLLWAVEAIARPLGTVETTARPLGVNGISPVRAPS